MVRILLWDLDGTLLDFKASESAAIKKCFAIFGFGTCTDEMVAHYSAINLRHWEMLERGERTRSQILRGRFEEFLASCGADPAAAEAFNLEYENRLTDTVKFMPGARETVLALRGRVRQCVVTNGNRLVQYPKMRRSGLDAIMERTFISEELGAEKPTKAFFDSVFTALGDGDPQHYLIVGDSLTSDMRGGVNAGIRTCWYNPGGADNTAGLPPDHEIADLREVLEIVE